MNSINNESIIGGAILIVDDEQESLVLLQEILSRSGYSVQQANNGETALYMIKNEKPELIILDIRMPGMDGFELCRQVKSDSTTSGIPILFISGYGQMEDKVRAFEVGGVDFITKPFQSYEIIARVKAHLSLRRMHQKLEKKISELERSNRVLQDFAFIASHDLQEPLRKISTFGDLILNKNSASLDERNRDYLVRMQEAAKRMRALLTSLLEYSRVTTKTEPFKQTDLNQSVRQALSNLSILIRETQGKVDVGDLPSLQCDQVQIVQVFQNLIGNALKFQEKDKNPYIKVYALPAEKDQKSDICRIFVEDNGIGFDNKHLNKLFMPFNRLHSKSDYDGVGMGLAICDKIIERHGGSITANSIPGHGSIFAVILPITQVKK
jgi:two-component system sensor histidine kinase/response regulator